MSSIFKFGPEFIQLKYKSSLNIIDGSLVNTKPLSYKIDTINEKWRKTGALYIYVNERGDCEYLSYSWKDVKFNRDLNSISFDAEYSGETYEVIIKDVQMIEMIYKCMSKPV